MIDKLEKGQKGWLVYFGPNASVEKRVVTPRKAVKAPAKKKPAAKKNVTKPVAPKKEAVEDKTATPEFQAARALIIQFIRSLESDKPIPLSKIKPSLLQLDPEFSEKKLGYRYFKHFAQALEGDLIEKMESSGRNILIHFRKLNGQASPPKKEDQSEEKSRKKPIIKKDTESEAEGEKTQGKKSPVRKKPVSLKKETKIIKVRREPEPKEEPTQKQPRKVISPKIKPILKVEKKADTSSTGQKPKTEASAKKRSPRRQPNDKVEGPADKSTADPALKEAKAFLVNELYYNHKMAQRMKLAKALIEGFGMYPVMTLEQMKTFIRERSGLRAPDQAFRTYAMVMKDAGAFSPSAGGGSLASKLLKLREGATPERLDGIYIEEIGKQLKQKFSFLNNNQILDLLF